jgi:hypothetical protein
MYSPHHARIKALAAAEAGTNADHAYVYRSFNPGDRSAT